MYASKTFVGHSLWLLPAQPALDALQEVVMEISVKRHSPCFKPHCTLLAGLPESEEEVIRKTRDLALRVAATPMTIDRVATKQLYFQSVFALIKAEDEAMNLHATAVEVFGVPEGGAPYMPHISLFYGDVDDDTRGAIKDDAQALLAAGGMSLGSPECELSMDTIEVWNTEGAVEEWRRCAVVPLSRVAA
eukprot:TRINITY_DN3707_c0_g1_i1.p1 TRINITY_DN3707_c0_g1~~TRINITY_DN3707_c0_g1_i1.p1  ORF type:complete len:190 (+),score=51.24 TRINITY_DN3707_c0_g1_i1:201-770(+)